MATKCPTCQQWFDSTESYDNHLPCHGVRTYGGASDLREARKDVESGGTGSNSPS